MRATLIAAALCLTALASAPGTALGAEGPAWTITLAPLPANFKSSGEGEYLVLATNVGAKATGPGASRVTVQLPPGFTVLAVSSRNSDPAASELPTCKIELATRTAQCETTKTLRPGRFLLVKVTAKAGAAEGSFDAQATVEGGGAANAASTTMPTAVKDAAIPFDFLSGFAAPANNPDGSPSVLAGSHPYQQTMAFGFPTRSPGAGTLLNDDHVRNLYIELPRGLLGDPGASEQLCTEVELTGKEGCPPASQVGITDITTLVGESGNNGVSTSNLYSMVPPPGVAAELATEVAGAGIFVHALATVRSGEDYGVQIAVPDQIAFGGQPIFNVQAQVWGDPSGEAHDQMRGPCVKSGAVGDPACLPPERSEVPFLIQAGDCSGQPLFFEAIADSWEEPSPPADPRKTSYESADLEGELTALEGCGELGFEPTITSRPTTTHADSPAGLDFSLHQPQEEPNPEPLAGRATAILRDATVNFPAGLAVNPSQASGLDACSEEAVGFEGEEEGVLYFTEDAQQCPDAAKIGTVEATSPLLVQRDGDHKVQIDPATGAPLPRALHGSLYLATPFENPFDSLIAVYLTVEDEATGLVAKLAGEGHLDPTTGQISTSFAENPEAPIEDIAVHLFGGDRGALITPQSCGSYETTADLTPWSAPEGLPAHPTDSFEVDSAPDGGACPVTQPNAPKLEAGTLEPVGGRYSPMVFKLTREDGSERLGRVEATLPPGLTAKLAGVGQCSDAEIAKAISREAPNQGAAELADPSCPASSQVGSVDVAAGAGPHPFHIGGRAYLAGPYEGAPLSFVIVTPAVAGPFDLGTVVVRTPVYINPETARPRAVSDPLPQIIDGVPADVRQITLHLDRPSFTLNPTSCDEEAFEGSATSALGHIAPLSERFQVGGCAALPFKPNLTLRLYGGTHRGSHPRLKAVLSAKPGEAGIARSAVALPHSEFIDQAHFRTICTRVQFAAKACPAGSVYGHVKAFTPLLGYPLEGPIYLRSSSHELPDVVAALNGPPSQPIEVDLDGRVDSVHGGVRTTFEAVPDAPVTKVIITMQGKKKGLFQNSTNICKQAHRATVRMDGQNGKAYDTRPVLKASCKHKKAKKKHRGHRRS